MSIETQYAKPWDAPRVLDNGGAVLNVQHRRFGAKGDGVTDDTAALAAVDVVAGLGYIPPGTYRVASALTLSGVWVLASGAKIQPASGVVVTITGSITAHGSSAWRDESAGGSFVLSGGDVLSDRDVIRRAQRTDGEQVRVLQIQPQAAGKAPFTIEVDNTTFLSTSDPILSIGYNVLATGNSIDPGENGFAWKIEADYNEGGARKIESYWQYQLEGVATVRPLFVNIDRTTHLTKLMLISDQLDFLRPNYADAALNVSVAQLRQAAFTLFGSDAGPTDINAKAAAKQKARLRLGYNGVDGQIELSQAISANMAALQVNGTSVYFTALVSGISSGGISIGTSTPLGLITLKPANGNLPATMIDANASQAAALSIWRSDTGTVYTTVSKQGFFTTRKAAAPADADLVNGELAIYGDFTAGASKVMAKIKATDGTVTTVALN